MSETSNYFDEYLGVMMQEDGEEEVVLHYGTKRHSGRYPWDPSLDRTGGGLSAAEKSVAEYDKWKAKGYADVDIAKKLGTTTTKMRADRTLAKAEREQRLAIGVNTAINRGSSVSEVATKMGISETSVRNYIGKDPNTVNSKRQIKQTAEALGEAVKRNTYVDIGAGVERQLGVSAAKLKAVTDQMVASGDYEVKKIWIEQLTNPSAGNTTVKVLVPKGTTQADVLKNKAKIRSVDFHLADGDATQLQHLQVPKSVDWKRLKIRYADGTGGAEDGQSRDGTMELRPGVADLDMGLAKYAQVRIAVGGTHYLKGMAIYGDEKDFPPGVDIIFNTNKGKNKTPQEVLKPIDKKGDGSVTLKSPNPFGASITRQNVLLDKAGNPVTTMHNGKKVNANGAINILQETGDWGDWGKALSAQFLSKQQPVVVADMLQKTLKKVDKDYEDIMKVDNPVIKQKLLEGYRSDLESKQVHLKAVAPKNFGAHVILPVPKMKETEVFAPNYPNGSKVILIRYPHGGTFEIPELVVNNKGPGKKVVGTKAPDAIGIHPSVAAKLSGADFDGDTVYVIPNNSGKFKSRPSLPGLKDFDPNIYEGVPSRKGYYKDEKSGKEYKLITPVLKGNEMGKVSNLITDMTLRGATDAELTRAVKHSMVVIDAEKHHLDYKRSEETYAIKALKEKYQTHIDHIDYTKLRKVNDAYLDQTLKIKAKLDNPKLTKAERTKYEKQLEARQLKILDGANPKKAGHVGVGAATIISRHKQTAITGGQEVTVTDVIKPGQKGNIRGTEDKIKTKVVIRKQRKSFITNMVDDARIFLNDNSDIREKHYVNYVNELKGRVKTVEKEMAAYKPPKQDKKAALIYQREVKSLAEKLNKSYLNAPKERLAQLLATEQYNQQIERAGGKEVFEKDKLKKMKNQAIVNARIITGASRTPVEITDEEWHAIQANAISPTKLKELTRHMNDDQLKELATPRVKTTVSSSNRSRIIALLNNNYTVAEVAELYGISTSTIQNIKKEEKLTASIDLDGTYYGVDKDE